MKSVIQWAINQTPAMNTIMLALLALGILCGTFLHREEFPRFDLEIILISVPYPGASPDEVERGVCQKIEEAVRSIDGIKKITSVASEGSGSVIVEIKSDAPDVQRILSEVESEVNRIPSFPELIEEPEIKQLTFRNPAITVGVVAVSNEAHDSEITLRDLTEKVREDLLAIPQISVANIQAAQDYQIDVEISETTLREYGLTLTDVADRLRLQNLELPGGQLKSSSQEFLLRGKNKRVLGTEIREIPLITKPHGVVLTVGDLGEVRDGFIDTTSISRINGNPGLAISVSAAAREDLIAMADAVRDYVAEKELPHGYEFSLWGDSSIDVRERLELLKRNGLQGLLLVFLVLAVFLELRLAFWVALGIPIAILGACVVLWQFDQTLNMLSMFAFLIALGIVVDDAIVIGENIYAHREKGKPFMKAAIDGTVEVVPSVATSIATTILAFMPMFFVTGVMGKFLAIIPLAVIAMLVISLLEATLILPCHLAHDPGSSRPTLLSRSRALRRQSSAVLTRWVIAPPVITIAFLFETFVYPFRRAGAAVGFVNRSFSRVLHGFIEKVYVPALDFSIRRPGVVISIIASTLLISFSLVRNGTVPWVIFPKMDARSIQAQIIYPNGTPSQVTDAATRRIEDAARRIHEQHKEKGEPLIRLSHRLVGLVENQAPGRAKDQTSGSHAGAVNIELLDNKDRETPSKKIVDLWRTESGEFPGAETLTFKSVKHGPGGTPIEFKLLGPAEKMDDLEAVVEECKEKLRRYPGTFDISDDSSPGKWEMQITVKDESRTLGVPLQKVAGTVRAAYYGEEVMRLQRGRHEVKLMVRYPENERHSLSDFSEIHVDAGDGTKRPVTELANIDLNRGYSEINRIDQSRSITIRGDVDETVANAANIVTDLQENFMPALLAKHPGIKVRWEGQQEQTSESMQSLLIGLAIALIAMYVLLTLEFTSYLQPALIMAVIPCGAIGALWGHAFMGLPFTLFSMLGLVALTGVVINDSIVLVDFINARVRKGTPLKQALLESGRRRFRPVILTSLTTIAGLLPILTEQSLQAQFLIPMANSLCFGLLFSTLIVLLLVPALYSVYSKVVDVRPQFIRDQKPQDPLQARKHEHLVKAAPRG